MWKKWFNDDALPNYIQISRINRDLFLKNIAHQREFTRSKNDLFNHQNNSKI